MQKYFLLLFLLAAPVSAQVVIGINVMESATSVGPQKNDGEYAFADVVISFDTNKFWYIFMTLAKTNGVELYVQDFEGVENGEKFINRYGIKSIKTDIDENGVNSIIINTVSDPHFVDFQSGNNLIFRFFKKSEPKIIVLTKPSSKISSFPVNVTFKCIDNGKREPDTLEYRLSIKAPDEAASLCGYPIGQWTPWAQGDSGSVVFDSLMYPGKYSVKVQARNKNTGVESKKIESKFVFKK